ncbi:MAG: hypothetical protein Q8S18_06825 [Bacteroidales bacterium]|nr:hypothetical protein [Bacteroidales bacterium]
MNFETPLSGGLLIIGSLVWDEHETRVSLRSDSLIMDKATLVPAPIRYGRKSEKRNTYTMVISSDCMSDEKIGIGSLVPFRNNIGNTTELDLVATSIINAEHKEIKSLNRYNWGWGCLALLINPSKSNNQNVKQLIEFWSSKFSIGFSSSDYVVADELPFISKQGQLFIDWKDEYGDLDFIVMTATKPTNPAPTALILSESFEMDNAYFMGNRENNIHTYQDRQIINFLNTAHEEKS